MFKKDLRGRRFGRLIALDRIKKRRITYYTCKCDCGNIKDICGTSLTGGITKSCGCYWLERVKETSTTHNMTGSKELKVWYHMHERCYNTKNKKFNNYGNRGIEVCPRWHKNNSNGFLNFYEDMGKKPSSIYTLHRIDNNKGYSPDNCKWADYYEQNNHRSNSVRIKVDGKKYTKKQTAKILGVSLGSIERLQIKYTFESIVEYLRSGPNKNRNRELLIEKG